MDNVIVVASGKGGTGKSTVCICLSVALVKKGKKVLLIDCDCGMRGLDIMLDIEQDILFDASDAVCGNCRFDDAIYKSRHNDSLYLMAAPFDAENELSPFVFKQLVDAARSIKVENTDFHITISMGVAMYPENGANYDYLFNAADRALYQVKTAGRDGYSIASSGVRR